MPKKLYIIDDLSAGRNGFDAPQAIANNECVDAVNVEWYRSKFARKRHGGVPISLTFSAGGPFVDHIVTLMRHVPGTNEGAAELWAIDNTGIVGRMAGAATFMAPTFSPDGISGNFYDVSWTTINGHLMLAFQAGVARMHVWDGSTVRRTGIAQSGAYASVLDNGAGAYAAVLRYYRNRFTVQVAGITIRRSEPTSSGTAFTPSGGGASAQITIAAAPGEGETHWEVEASLDNVTFYRIATVAIGVATYDDSAATTTYNTNPLSALTGTYTVQKPYRYVAADQNRVLGLGSYTATDKQSRLEISAVIGSLDIGDEERVDTTTNYYIDFDEADSGGPIGLNGPIYGSFFVFKFKEIAQLTPTGQTSAPYSVKFLSKTIGAVTNRSIVQGEDEDGNPCLYWMSHKGPYRWGVRGLEYIGRGVEDLILGPTSVMYTVAGDNRLAHGIFFADKRQVWFSIIVNFSTSYYSLVLADGAALGGYWHFQEAAGNAADSSGNGFLATAVGGLTYSQPGGLQDGTFGIGFNGTTGYFDVTNNVALACGSGPFTCEFWAKGTANGSAQYVAGKFDGTAGWFVAFDAAGSLHFLGTSTTGANIFNDLTPLTYLDGIMRHYVVTWDPSNDVIGKIRMYVNGVLVFSGNHLLGPDIPPVGNSASQFKIGVEPSAAVSGFFNGTLDEVAIYKATALTQTQVSAHYVAALALNNRVTLKYDIPSGGWSRYTGALMQSQLASVMFANTLGASMSLDLKPYVSVANTVALAQISKMDTGYADGTGQGIQAYVIPKIMEPYPGFTSMLSDGQIIADLPQDQTLSPSATVTITDTVTPDFGSETAKVGTATITVGSATKQALRLEDGTFAGFQFYSHQIGDPIASIMGWNLDRFIVWATQQEDQL